jgi:TP901 family phage tail tape measure protein
VADRTVTYKLRAELTQFRAQMAQGSLATKKLADDLTSVDAAGAKSRRGLDTFGNAAGKIGLVAAAGFGAAVLQAANFDQAMSNVQAATHESTQNMEALREAALQAGEQTVFSATESAAAIENLAKAGVSTADILGGGLQGALDLAAAGSLEVADAAEIAATALTQFGLSGEDVPHVADLLAAGAGKAQGEVTDLAFALKQSGLVAAQMGISVEETTGALAAFASAGLLGSDAGTSFRTMLLRLANPSKESMELMEGLGISAYDLQGNFVGIEALAGQLQVAFQGQTQATRDAALATIFGSDSIRAANVLYEQGAQGISEWNSKVNDSGYAAETAATKLDNLKGDLEELGGALQSALIGTGDGSQGPLRALTQRLTDVVNAYNDLPPAAQSAVGALLAGGALIGGSIWVGVKLIQGISNTREALDNLGISGAKAQRAMKGLASAGVALAGIAVVAKAFNAIETALDGAIPGTEKLTGLLLDLKDGQIEELGGRFDELSDSIGRLTDANKAEKVGDTVLGAIGLEGRRLGDAKEEIGALDAALSNLVTSGSPEIAAEALAAVAESSNLTAEETERLLTVLPGYTEALAGVANDSELAAAGSDSLATAERNVGKVAQVTTERLKAQRAALQEQIDAATATADSFFDLGDSLDKGKVSLKGWLRELEKQAEALRNFRVNAEDAAKKGLTEGLIQALQEAGPEGALRMKQLANATESEIERANKAWKAGQREVGKYVDATVKVPKKTSTWVTVDSDHAMAKLREFRDLLNDATKPRTARLALTILMDQQGYQTRGGVQRAQGGPVYGPGSATSDSIPAWLSNGEFVIKAAAVQHYGPDFFHKLNAMRLASGGMVGRSSAPSVTVNTAGSSIDYGRLADAILSARPTYGNVTNNFQTYDQFKQQERRDRQAAGLGGVPR